MVGGPVCSASARTEFWEWGSTLGLGPHWPWEAFLHPACSPRQTGLPAPRTSSPPPKCESGPWTTHGSEPLRREQLGFGGPSPDASRCGPDPRGCSARPRKLPILTVNGRKVMVIMQAWEAGGVAGRSLQTGRAPPLPGQRVHRTPDKLSASCHSSTEGGVTHGIISEETKGKTHQVEQGKCVIYFPNNLEQSTGFKEKRRHAINKI